MAPSARVASAFRAMKNIGIPESKVKPVLKNLLRLYDKNWEPIEAENYRVLADAIFDADDTEVSEKKTSENGEDCNDDENGVDEPERPLKRLRSRNQEEQVSVDNSSSRPHGSLLKVPKEEQVLSPVSNSLHNSGRVGGLSSSPPDSLNTSSDTSSRKRPSYKGKEPLLPEDSSIDKRPRLERPTHALQIREPTTDSGIVLVTRKKVSNSHLLITPKDEPVTDDMPVNDTHIKIQPESINREDSSGKLLQMSNGQGSFSTHSEADEENGDNRPASSNETRGVSDLTLVPGESTTNLEIASSQSGEVKILLSCDSLLGRPNFRMPCQDELLKSMQEKCLQSYKILDPNFSVVQMLKDMCECFLELGTDSSDQSQERSMNVIPQLNILKKSVSSTVLGLGCSEEFFLIENQSSNGLVNNYCTNGVSGPNVPSILSSGIEDKQASQEVIATAVARNDDRDELSDPGLCSLVVVPDGQLTSEQLRAIHNINDLTKGEELVEIPWFSENNDSYPPTYNYIPKSLIFQNAYVNFTLSHIGADYCCSNCFGDCLTSVTPCACANETGCLFAYSSDGLVKEDFLEECISMTLDPQRQSFHYCRLCILEASKGDDVIEPCKGHLKRKYIKECWSKCGCNKQCGNRVVQRGLRCKLQVFWQEGKGWGLRTLERLPKGAFVCEYVGEVLTTKELYERNAERSRSTHSKSSTYPIVLDALWFVMEVLQDEQALCLDASNYANIARFINHRCLDANLIEIPVKIESPDHHYYHLAFFTTREVEAMEELTWDYGIEFGDSDNPIEKAFRCECGSKFCRNMKRFNRSTALFA